MSETLPSFKRPPVVETALGVQFDPLSMMTNAHLGAFWTTLGSGWPHVADAPPLDQAFERFGEERLWERIGSLRLKLLPVPQIRLQITNTQKDRMLQIQNGRLHYNWLGHGGTPYARYEAVRPEFDEMYDRFMRFAADKGLGPLRLNQWEITYVNHLPKGTVWDSPGDWKSLFPNLLAPAPAVKEAVPLESFGSEWHYVIEPKRGRLHVELQHGRVETPDIQVEALILKLTARGPIGESETFATGIDLGHATIVESFKNVTSEEARRYWEQEQ